MKRLVTLILCLILSLFCLTSLVGCGELDANKVNVIYYSTADLVKKELSAGTEKIGIIPDPAATLTEKGDTSITWHRLDLQELYDGTAKGYPQAVLMVKSSLLKAYPNLVSQIESKIEENVAWAKANAQTAVNAITSKLPTSDLQQSPVSDLKVPMLNEKAINGCKIYAQSAVDAKTSVVKYINDMIAVESTSAKAVTDDFFYTGSMESGEWNKETITFYAPDGAPAVSIAKFINDAQNFETGKTVDYKVVKSSEIGKQIATATADIILMPITAATKTYNAGNNANDSYKLVSVITHGNFYIMSREQLTLSDLKGKRVAVPLPNGVPDLTFRAILKANGLEVKVLDN